MMDYDFFWMDHDGFQKIAIIVIVHQEINQIIVQKMSEL